ncbi:hypothetical protein KUCAC02_020440, partial [Chaenocephalus aceratus]
HFRANQGAEQVSLVLSFRKESMKGLAANVRRKALKGPVVWHVACLGPMSRDPQWGIGTRTSVVQRFLQDQQSAGGASAGRNKRSLCREAVTPRPDDELQPYKVDQDRAVLHLLDITQVKRKRPKVQDVNKQKDRNVSVKYNLLCHSHPEKVPAYKATFIKVFEYNFASLHESITLPWERDRDSVDSQLHLTSRPATRADTRAATRADTRAATRADTRAATLQCVSGSFQLARSFLCIPATSTPSERIFSGGHICSQKSLSRDHVERGDVNEAQLGEDEASERKACWQSRRPL